MVSKVYRFQERDFLPSCVRSMGI